MTLRIMRASSSDLHHIDWLEANTPNGNFVIKNGHAPTILILSPGQPVIFHVTDGKEETLLVRSGVADIKRDGITLLLSEEA